MVTKPDFLEMEASLGLNRSSQNVANGWLPTYNAVRKQPSIPLIDLGRKWTLSWWWWWLNQRRLKYFAFANVDNHLVCSHQIRAKKMLPLSFQLSLLYSISEIKQWKWTLLEFHLICAVGCSFRVSSSPPFIFKTSIFPRWVISLLHVWSPSSTHPHVLPI